MEVVIWTDGDIGGGGWCQGSAPLSNKAASASEGGEMNRNPTKYFWREAPGGGGRAKETIVPWTSLGHDLARKEGFEEEEEEIGSERRRYGVTSL